MTEIEKLYSFAGIEKIGSRKCTTTEYLDCQNYCFITEDNKCNKYLYDYPPFTAEKQIELIKIFCKRYLEVSQHVEENGDLCFGVKATVGDFAVGFNKDFAECLADFVNSLWQDLTEAEQNEIRNILKGD